MTLSLLKKHPTTQANSQPWTASSWGRIGLCLVLTGCFTHFSSAAHAQSAEAPAELLATETPVAETNTPAAKADPIERLRKRSALERWEKLSKGWKQRANSKENAAQEITQKDEPNVRRLPFTKSTARPIDTVGPRLQAVESSSSSPVPSVLETDPGLDVVPIPEDQKFNDQPVQAVVVSEPERELVIEVPQEDGELVSGQLFRTASLNNTQVQGNFKNETPTEIKKITEISPFADYEPDFTTRNENPCRNQCPRPEGLCNAEDRFSICPELNPLSEDEYEPRSLPSSLYAWEAPNLYHNPLYFEDPQLERYGHTYNEMIQPFVSIGKFGVQLVGLPYQMTIDPVCKRKYTLGWYRPGECAPKKHYQIPFNKDAAAVQAAATTGMIFLIP